MKNKTVPLWHWRHYIRRRHVEVVPSSRIEGRPQIGALLIPPTITVHIAVRILRRGSI